MYLCLRFSLFFTSPSLSLSFLDKTPKRKEATYFHNHITYTLPPTCAGLLIVRESRICLNTTPAVILNKNGTLFPDGKQTDDVIRFKVDGANLTKMDILGKSVC